MGVMNIYLLVGLLVHVAFLGLADWLAYRHVVTHGYDHTVLILGVLNVVIGCGIYYLIYLPMRRHVRLRRMARDGSRDESR